MGHSAEEYAGPERRRWQRSTPSGPRAIGRARVGNEFTRVLPALEPGVWYEVIEPPVEYQGERMAGYVWIRLHGRPRHVWAAHLEIESAD